MLETTRGVHQPATSAADRDSRRPVAGSPPAPSELTHLRPDDVVGVGFVAACAALTGLALFLSARGGLVSWLAGQLLLAVAFVQWFALLHECGHETLFRTKRLHGAVGHLASFFALIPFHAWKQIHRMHHKWTGWQDLDPTTAALVPRPLGRLERALVNVCWKYWVPLFSVLYRVGNYWNLRRLRTIFPRRDDARRLTGNVLLLLAGYAAVLWLAGPTQVARLAGPGLLLALVFQDALLLSQHTHIPQHVSRGEKVRPYPTVEQEVFTRSLRFPAWFSTGVLLNLDAHELHHMYPQVPGYDLRRIDYGTENEVDWWRWIRSARRVPGDVFLFQNRSQSGFDI